MTAQEIMKIQDEQIKKEMRIRRAIMAGKEIPIEWEEVSQESYKEARDCIPPRFAKGGFFSGEDFMAGWAYFYIEKFGRFYTALLPLEMDYEELHKGLESFIAKKYDRVETLVYWAKTIIKENIEYEEFIQNSFLLLEKEGKAAANVENVYKNVRLNQEQIQRIHEELQTLTQEKGA